MFPVGPNPMYQAGQNYINMLNAYDNYKTNKTANALNQLKLKYEPQLLQAQVESSQQKANDPYAGMVFPGAAGQVQGLQYIANTYGTNSPQYQNALNAFNTNLQAQQAKAQYFSANSQLKYLPTIVKLQKEREQALQNNNPDRANEINAQIQKEASDAQTRKQALGAQNLLEEANKIDVTPLQAYSGGLGSLQAGIDKVKMALGMHVPDDFRKYDQFKTQNSKFMSDTIRQALQTSVMPTYVASMISPLVDPNSSIYNDPQQVAIKWNGFKDWLKDYAEQKTEASQYGVPENINGQTANANQQQANTSQSLGGYTPEEIKDYATRKKMTVTQVENLIRSKLGG